MSTRRTLVIAGLIFLALAIYSLIVASGLPDIVPTHWNVHNQPDQFGSKWTAVLIMPGVMAMMMLLIVALPALSPKKFEIDTFRGTFNYIMLLVMAMQAALGFTILEATKGHQVRMDRILLAIIFLFFGLLGNVLGKVRRNFYMGIRTPWTLADEKVWDKTHRSAAKIWTVGGVLGCVIAMIGVPFWVTFTLLIGMALVPVVQSYFFYRKMDRSGTLTSGS
jgi:uncharacterized membrane protein